MRLDPRFRFALYGAFSALFLTGAGWLAVDGLKSPSGDDLWQTIAAKLLMAHGGSAMVMLMLLGALAPLHVGRAWRSRRNRATGAVMMTLNTALIATAFGLYYFGSDALRLWTSRLHIGAGLCLPIFIAIHIWVGRTRRPPSVW